MKKNVMSMLGALAMTAAVAMVFGACSSEDNMVADNGAADGKTAVRGVTVTVSAGIGDNTDPTPAPPLDGRGVAGAVTRSAVVTGTDAETGKTTRTLKFTSGDKLHVYHKKDSKNYKAGILSMVGEPTNDGKNATFSGEITGYTKPPKDNYYEVNGYYDFGADPLVDTKATLIHKDAVERTTYDIHDGDITLHAPTATDVATVMTTCLEVSGYYVSGSGYTLTSDDALFNCTFTGLAAETKYAFRMYYFDGSAYYSHAYGNMTTDENGTGIVAFKHKIKDEYSWVFTISNSDLNFEATIDLGTRAFEAGKVYNVSRHWTGEAFSKTIDLSTINHDLLVGSGMTLTGTLATPVKISIADGATVTLAGATIDGKSLNSEDSWDYDWAGLTCLGNANIVLADGTKNKVTYFHTLHAGVQVGPEGTTLTISGGTDENAGKLTAEGKAGAGIGGWFDGFEEVKFGNLIINGGDITAKSMCGAGIGGAIEMAFGDITISAYKVWAESTYSGASIGCGQEGNCGDITISAGEGFVSLTAKKALNGTTYRPIGLSDAYDEYYCGKITLFGTVIYDPDPESGKNKKDYGLDGIKTVLFDTDDETWTFYTD